MTGTFPFLFLHGSQPDARSKHLLMQHSNQFGSNQKLNFTLFNQTKRHAAARAVGDRVKANPGAIEQFAQFVNRPEFTVGLEKANKNRTGKVADWLLKHLLPTISIAGANVPFCPVKRPKAIIELYELCKMF